MGFSLFLVRFDSDSSGTPVGSNYLPASRQLTDAPCPEVNLAPLYGRGKRSHFIFIHETAVPDHFSRQDRGKPALNALLGHGEVPS
jgi:hypothetical protein